MLNEDYKEMLQCLSEENVTFLLVGAYAVAAYRHPDTHQRRGVQSGLRALKHSFTGGNRHSGHFARRSDCKQARYRAHSGSGRYRATRVELVCESLNVVVQGDWPHTKSTGGPLQHMRRLPAISPLRPGDSLRIQSSLRIRLTRLFGGRNSLICG